jgi:hypothetical protein
MVLFTFFEAGNRLSALFCIDSRELLDLWSISCIKTVQSCHVFSLVDLSKICFPIGYLWRRLADDPTAVADPYGTLKELLLESYGLTEEQKTSRWLDYPMCGSETRPSVLWDNLLALRPKTLDDAQVALFIEQVAASHQRPDQH